MANDWQTRHLVDAPLSIIDGDRGKNYPKQGDFAPVGYCLFLNTGNVTENGFNFSRCSFIAEEKDNALRKGKLETVDVVLTTRGTVGNVAFYDERVPFKHIRINSGMVILRADYKNILPRFLYFFLKSDLFKGQIKAFSTGSAQPQLPIRDIKHITISVPPLNEQHTISGILGNIDDKIALNLQMNETLEKIGQALFKHWFIDFEFPNEKGKPYRLSGGEMVDSELGEIPKEWDVRPFSEVIAVSPRRQLVKGSVAKKVSMADLERWQSWITSWSREEYKGGSVFKNGDTLFARITPCLEQGKTASVSFLDDKEVAFGSTEFIVLSPKIIKSTAFIFFLSRSTNLRDEAIMSMTGTSGRQRVPNEFFDKYLIVCPPHRLIDTFDKLVRPMMVMINNNAFGLASLGAIRDSLLPKLMSGQIRVPAG